MNNTPKLAEEREWIEVLLEKVNFDPAELGSKWSLEDIIEFVSELLRNKDRELATFKAQVRKEIEERKFSKKELDEADKGWILPTLYLERKGYNDGLDQALSILKEASNE